VDRRAAAGALIAAALLWSACARSGLPVSLSLEPDRPVAERDPARTTWHVVLVAESHARRELEVDGVRLPPGGAVHILRTVHLPPDPAGTSSSNPGPVPPAGADPALTVTLRDGTHTRRVTIPFVPGHDDFTGAPDLHFPLAARSRVSRSFHSANHATPGRRHAVDLVPQLPEGPPGASHAGELAVLSPCDARVVALTAHRPDGSTEANELHLERTDGLVVVLSHLARGSIDVGPGALVHRGQRIAAIGHTGRTTGLHLHVEVRGRDGATVPFRIEGAIPERGMILVPRSPR
jgi:hypothetical protein